MGKLFEKEIKLCISIKGITPFLVLAFFADIGDIKRFKNVRGFDASPGVVPTVKSSGGKTQMGAHQQAIKETCENFIYSTNKSYC